MTEAWAGQIDPLDKQTIDASSGTSIDRASVETAIPKETLRAWERRYAFPRPRRDDNGDRIYSAHEIDKLKALKRLVDIGHRPSAIADRTLIEMRALYRESMLQASACFSDASLEPLLDLVRRHDVRALRRALKARMQDGLEQFVLETAAPLSATVGIQWALGELESFQDRLVTELLQNCLLEGQPVAAESRGSPVIALATLPDEKHPLGLRMAQALFAVHGAQCIYLGTQVPVEALSDVAIAQDIDVVAIAMSSTASLDATRQAMVALDTTLPAGVEVWFSGAVTRGPMKTPMRVRSLSSLTEIRPVIQRWHAARPLRRSQRYYH